MRFIGPSRTRAAAIERAAGDLASRIAPFAPDCVVYVREGGAPLGRAVARALGIPGAGLDIRYPASRLPGTARALLWPIKEILYRFTRPAAGARPDDLPGPGSRVALVDDSASSGRTLRAALRILEDAGIPRGSVRVAVGRCGRRCRALVDVALR